MIAKNITHYIANPLNAYLLIKRATSDIKLIESRFPEKSKKLLENIKDFRPDDVDLSGAVEGLLRLQFIYKLKSSDFSKGIIDGRKTREALSLHDLFVVGKEASQISNSDYFAIEYLKMVWNEVKQGHDIYKEINEKSLLTFLATCHNRTGDFENALKYIDIVFDKYPESSEYMAVKEKLLEDKIKFGTTKLSINDPFSEDYEKDGRFQMFKEYTIYSQVCRGSLTKSPSEISQLHCRYVSTNPFTKLARFKAEEVNIEPYILVFHDVLSNNEVDILTSAAKSKTQRAKISPGKQDITNSERVAQNAWHYDSDHEMFTKISQRVEVSLIILNAIGTLKINASLNHFRT